MRRKLSLGTHVVATMLAFLVLFNLVPAQMTDSDAAITNLRGHLLGPSRRTYSQPLLFVGVIEAFGPIYMGVCKEGVGESVDFRIESVLLGSFQGKKLHASYINCTGKPSPPPFTLRGRVIVYCEQSHSLKCLIPVEFSEQRLAMIKSWLSRADSPKQPHQ